MTGKEYIEWRINTGDRFLVNLHKDSRDLLASILNQYAALRQPPVSGALPLLEDCKKAATDYADKKGGSSYGDIFRAYQEGINWALNWVCKRQ